MELHWQTPPAKRFMVWGGWQAVSRYLRQTQHFMLLKMCLTARSEASAIFLPSPVHGDASLCIRHRDMMEMQVKNTRCYTYCTEAEKMKEAGLCKGKQTLFSIILLQRIRQNPCWW